MAAGWSDKLTRSLIEVCGDFNARPKLDDVHRNQAIYGKIAREMEKLGYTKTWLQCRTKIKNLTQQYIKVRGQLYFKANVSLCTKPVF